MVSNGVLLPCLNRYYYFIWVRHGSSTTFGTGIRDMCIDLGLDISDISPQKRKKPFIARLTQLVQEFTCSSKKLSTERFTNNWSADYKSGACIIYMKALRDSRVLHIGFQSLELTTACETSLSLCWRRRDANTRIHVHRIRSKRKLTVCGKVNLLCAFQLFNLLCAELWRDSQGCRSRELFLLSPYIKIGTQWVLLSAAVEWNLL